jgi:hypothetical protein
MRPFDGKLYMRCRRTILFLVFLVLTVVPGWLTYRTVHQDYLNCELISAIKRMDDPTALALLDRGADANAREVLASPVSFWQCLLNTFCGQSSQGTRGDPALLLLLNYASPRDEEHGRWHPRENVALIRALISHGAHVNVKDKVGYTPLHYTVQQLEAENMRLLLEAGADPNAGDMEGETTLMLLVRCINVTKMFPPYEEMLRMLIARGADVNIRNKAGETALSMVYKEDIHLRKRLRQAAAKE